MNFKGVGETIGIVGKRGRNDVNTVLMKISKYIYYQYPSTHPFIKKNVLKRLAMAHSRVPLLDSWVALWEWLSGM